MTADDRDFVFELRPRALCVQLPRGFKVCDRVGPDDIVTWVDLSRTWPTPAAAWRDAAERVRSNRPATEL